MGYEALHDAPLHKDGGSSGSPGLDYGEHELCDARLSLSLEFRPSASSLRNVSWRTGLVRGEPAWVVAAGKEFRHSNANSEADCTVREGVLGGVRWVPLVARVCGYMGQPRR